MPRLVRLISISFGLCILTVTLLAQATAPASSIRFRITLSNDLAASASSGRLFVLMTDSPQPRDVLTTGFSPGSVWIAAMEVEQITAGGVIEFNPDLKAFPHPFSQAKPGNYQFMALLDPDHSYAYHGMDAGDLTSQVTRVENVNPAAVAPIELTLSRLTPARFKPTDTETVKLVEFQSAALTAFWGRPIHVRAGVVLPPGYSHAGKRFATVYHVHGFGGDHTAAWRQSQSLIRGMTEGKYPEMVHVFLDGSFPTGHHEFADSVNNGPWGRVLTTEFIPHLEKRFRLVATASARFLTGHSSGGWSTLWLQVTYPDFFGGTWSTAPDPADLRSFTGINATPGSTDNAFRKPDGRPKNLVRRGKAEIASIEEFAQQEEVTGDYGGQFASFEWVWSPRGQDGRPMKAFNRTTGALNQEVLKYWENYDIRLLLARNWSKLGPKLKGRLNIFCGGADTFHLEEATIMLCDFLKEKGSDAVCEIVPDRDHSNLYLPYQTYPDGLAVRIYQEMGRRLQASQKPLRKSGR